MNLGVVIPFRASHPDRVASAERVVRHLQSTFLEPFELVLADDGFDPFSRGASINVVAWPLPVDVYLVCDADLIVPADQLREVVRLAGESSGLVVPFSRYLYLTVNQTRRITEAPNRALPTRPRAHWNMSGSVGGAGAFDRRTLAVTGGYPPIFRGWGMEDVAFELLADELAGPTRRVEGDALHLYHPVDATNDPQSPGYQRNVAALRRLIAARQHGPDALRAELEALSEVSS